jgi:hypothetical protein
VLLRQRVLRRLPICAHHRNLVVAQQCVVLQGLAVSVVVETMKQLEAQMLMRNYEGFIK